MIWGETHYSWKHPFFALQMLAEGTIVMVNKGIVQAVSKRCVFFPRRFAGGRPFKGGKMKLPELVGGSMQHPWQPLPFG